MKEKFFKNNLNILANRRIRCDPGSDASDDAPRFDQTVDAPCGVGRTGRRKHASLPVQRRKEIAVIAVIRLLSVAEDCGNRRFVQDDGEIVRNDVADGTVRTAFDGAAADAVPKRDAVSFKKPLFLRNGVRNGIMKNRGKNAPETVLRMSVKEHLLPRFDGGKTAQNQNMRIRPIERGKGMDDLNSLHAVIIPYRNAQGNTAKIFQKQ